MYCQVWMLFIYRFLRTWSASPCRVPEQRGGQPPAWLPQDGQPCPLLTTWAALSLARTAAERSLKNWDALMSLDSCNQESKSILSLAKMVTHIPAWYHDVVKSPRTSRGRGQTKTSINHRQCLCNDGDYIPGTTTTFTTSYHYRTWLLVASSYGFSPKLQISNMTTP